MILQCSSAELPSRNKLCGCDNTHVLSREIPNTSQSRKWINSIRGFAKLASCQAAKQPRSLKRTRTSAER